MSLIQPQDLHISDPTLLGRWWNGAEIHLQSYGRPHAPLEFRNGALASEIKLWLFAEDRHDMVVPMAIPIPNGHQKVRFNAMVIWGKMNQWIWGYPKYLVYQHLTRMDLIQQWFWLILFVVVFATFFPKMDSPFTKLLEFLLDSRKLKLRSRGGWTNLRWPHAGIRRLTMLASMRILWRKPKVLPCNEFLLISRNIHPVTAIWPIKMVGFRILKSKEVEPRNMLPKTPELATGFSRSCTLKHEWVKWYRHTNIS